jgi:hypothetical protein
MREQSSRDGRPRSVLGRFTAGVTVAALLAASLPVVATAEEPPFHVDLEVVAERLLATQVQIHYSGAAGIERLLLSAEVLEWRRQNPTASGSEGTHHLESLYDGLHDGLRTQDRVGNEAEMVMRGISVLFGRPESTAASAPLVRRMVEVILDKSLGAFDTREDVVAGSLRNAAWIGARVQIEADVYAAVRQRALVDPEFAGFWSEVIGYPVDPAAPLATLAHDPRLDALVDVDAILARQASRAEFMEEIKRQFGLVALALESESVHARERLVASAAACPVQPQPSCTPEQQAAAKAQTQAAQKDVDVGASAAKILGALARIGDAKTGEKIEKAATAWYSIITAINKYGSAVGGMGLGEMLESAATVALTGDILGAVVTLVGLFSDSGPSLDQQILNQVKELQKEVRALHQDMQASFQRVDMKLDLIFETMNIEFARLGVSVAANTAALTDIQNQLANQGLRLESVAASILVAIGDVELHDARSDVNQYIGFRENYGQPIPSFLEYTGPENEFHLTATDLASHSAFVVAPSLAFDPSADPTALLDVNGESAALSYLARRAHARDPRVNDPIQPFANPSVWNFGAQAYGLLALQNPGFAAQVSETRSQQIQFEGERILGVAASFSRPNAQPAPADRLNPIFQGLIADYRAALKRVGNRMIAIRSSQVVSRFEPGFAQPVPKSYGLFGPVNQSIPATTLPPDATTLHPCTSPIGPALSRPTNVTFTTLPMEVRFAHYAYAPDMAPGGALPEMSVCYDAGFVDEREVVTAAATFEYAKLRIAMRTRFRFAGAGTPEQTSWLNVRSATYTWPEMLISKECHSIHCAGDTHVELLDAIVARWPKDKGIFQASATLANDAAVVGSIRTRMTAFLNGRRYALYALAAKDAHDAGTEMNGAGRALAQFARELQAYTRLGFGVALGADEILSSVLFGRYPLIVNKATDAQLEASFVTAANAYVCAPTVAPGEPCFGGPFDPLRDQPFVETLAGTVNEPLFCAESTASVPVLTSDPVGNCLMASGTRRVEALESRLRLHTEDLEAGRYVERLPWIGATMEMLPLVDTLVRTP